MDIIVILCKMDWILNLISLIGLIGIGLGATAIYFIKKSAREVGKFFGISYALLTTIWTLVTIIVLITNLSGKCCQC